MAGPKQEEAARRGGAAAAEDMFAPQRTLRNPLVPLGALVTAGVLVGGLVAFKQGNYKASQQLMRARVIAQGATVALMVGTVYLGGLSLHGKGGEQTEASPAPHKV